MSEVNVQNRQGAQSQRETPGLTTREGPHAMRRDWAYPSFRNFFDPNPFAMMRHLNEEMDRAFGFSGMSSQGRGEWTPAIDVAEHNGELRIKADLPGIDSENVQVEVNKNILTISGERKYEHEEDSAGVHRMERSYGSFMRSIPLPEGVKVDQARGEFNNGVLQISFPMEQQQQSSRQIPISAGSASSSQSGSSSQQSSSSNQQSSSTSQDSGTRGSRTGPQTADPASLGKEIDSERGKQGSPSKVA